jgi:hypothetical protein
MQLRAELGGADRLAFVKTFRSQSSSSIFQQQHTYLYQACHVMNNKTSTKSKGSSFPALRLGYSMANPSSVSLTSDFGDHRTS